MGMTAHKIIKANNSKIWVCQNRLAQNGQRTQIWSLEISRG
jgi:hypothetical protein